MDRLPAILLLISACSRDKPGTTETPETLDSDTVIPADSGEPILDAAALPSHVSVSEGRFTSHDACAECHIAGSDTLRDSDGRDVSPVTLWSGSMMANSARDPYFLARISRELEAQPGARDEIIAACTRCHAPAASVLTDKQVDLQGLLTGTSATDHLGREGTTCTVCHQITDEGLGEASSFTGGYSLGEDRQIFGPHTEPFTHPMEMHVDYTPVYSDHMLDSGVCASCHTVITEAVDPETGSVVGPPFPEQVPYLEWRNSDYADALSCQSCHMPQTDEDGDPIVTRLSTKPPNDNISARDFMGRHTLVGGNAYMLGLMADNADWTQPIGGETAARGAAAAAAAFLTGAAQVSLATATDGGTLSADVTITNLAGHKLPTGYPSRRAFVRLTVTDSAGSVLWRSGRTDDSGRLIDAKGSDIDGVGAHPHRDTITDESEVQIYESVMYGLDDKPTSLLFQAARYGKDNRLLPAGWSPDHADAALTAPVGTDGDLDHTAGSDTVRYRLPLPPGAAQVTAELIYQSVPMVHVTALQDTPTPLVERFADMASARPDTGHAIASETVGLD